MAFEIGLSRGEAELLALARILAWAFGFEAADARAWLDRGGVSNVRLARRDDDVVGGLLEIPMGQWFGGRSVPMLGLAGVAVAPAARGEHVALSMVLASLRAARERGLALSALYPATFTLYRRAGYELAGSRYRHTALLQSLPTERSPLGVTPLDASHIKSIDALYRRVARERPGYLDRGDYVWQRVRETRQGAIHSVFGVLADGALEGYVYLTQRGPDDQRELVVHDFAVATPAASARLLAFFADHRSTVKSLVFHGASPDPLHLAASEHAFRVELANSWMLRVVNVEAALAARGYPPVDASVDFELTDASLPENSGRYRLAVTQGVASVSRGGAGTVKLDERTLAALYSGFMTPAELMRAARLEAGAASLPVLTLLFGGPAPAMADFF
jgi:predicted acetyltransferase